jgi:hypothetical protein
MKKITAGKRSLEKISPTLIIAIIIWPMALIFIMSLFINYNNTHNISYLFLIPIILILYFLIIFLLKKFLR